MSIGAGHCLVLVARATRAAQFGPAKSAQDAGFALARFVPIDGAMFSKGSTAPPTGPARVFSGSKAPSSADRVESGRSSSESAVVAHGDSRPIESHWEAVIDRATD
jgi:hypothetical protein